MAESQVTGERFATLVEAVRDQALRLPEREACRFLLDGESRTVQWSYHELDLRARALAVALRRRTRGGERAVLLYPPGLEFIAAFFGCLYAGVIAVPAYPPSSRRTLPRLAAILRDACPALVLTSAEILAQARSFFAVMPELARLDWLATDEPEDPAALAARAGAWQDPGLTAETVAFLQYTSGSTSEPKGVEVHHGHLIHNQHMIRNGFEQTSESVVVGWLPLYHDMGLIGNVMQPLYLGARCILMSPLAFLKAPVRWLEAISRYRATTSGGPNFAYDLCVRKISPPERQGLDLASWTVAYNGAEPVRAGTLERFSAAFAAHGFRREAFYPCYGLAEATLFVTGGDPRQAAKVVTVDGPALEQHRVVPPGEGGEGSQRRLVGCGRVGAGERLLIVDPETHEPLAADRVGEIWVAGPSVAQGYWRKPEETERVFAARTATGDGPFLRTGDLGFLEPDGELVVTGRLKDLIILRGRNHYPQDLELTSEKSHPALRPGGCAAFALDVGDEERLAIVQEIERSFRGDAGAVAAAIRQAVAEKHQVHAHTVVLIRAGSLAKTSSGKVRRRHTRELLLARELQEVAASVSETVAEVVDAGPDFNREELRMLGAEPRRQALLDYLRYLTARVARQAPETIAAAAPLTAIGLDSLMAVELKNLGEAELGVELSLADLLQGPSLEELAARLEPLLMAPPEAGRLLPEPAPAAGAETASGPLSYGQRALWFLQRLAPESSAYTVAGALCVKAALDVDKLRRCFDLLARRHAALRTTFHATPEGPRQEILAEPRVAFTVEDAAAASARELEERVAREVGTPFDLERDALVRVAVLSRGERDAVVVLVLHHVICDLASLGVLLGELRTLYELPPDRAAEALAPLPLAYGDYVRWQERLLDSPAGERLWQYWQRRLAGELPVLALPTDRPRPPHQRFRGAARRELFSVELSGAVRGLAEGHGTTLYTVLLAAFQALLARYSAQRDVLVGTPALGRTRAELGPLVGYFVNPVVMRAELGRHPSFTQHLAAVRERVIEALVHQDYPFALLVERLQPQRDPSRSPIFQAMFGLQQSDTLSAAEHAAFVLGRGGVALDFAGLPAQSLPPAQRIAQFDLELVAAEMDGQLGFSLLYDTELFDGTTAARLLEHFRLLLAGVAAAPQRDVLTLPLLSPAERQLLYHEWNDRAAADEPGRLFHRLFEAQAARTPDGLALACGAAALTYAELNRRANRLARALTDGGAAPEARVAVLAERGPDLAAAIVAIFKAGAVYVPLDPRYPEERLRSTLEQCRSSSLLVAAELLPLAARAVAGLAAAPPLRELDALLADRRPEANLPLGVSAESLAYVIFTSGSTGVPKGAMVVHRGMLNHLMAKIEDLAITEADKVAQNASQCFDISVWQFLAALLVGGSVRIFPDAVAYDPARLPAAVEATGITLLETVPSMLRAMLAPPAPTAPSVPSAFAALRWLIPTGEALSPELSRQWLELQGGIPLVNAYGPTECSDDVTHAVLRRAPGPDALRVPIGRPIRNTRLYVLDAAFFPVPAGTAGELCVGGRGVGRGYLDDPRRTAEAFRPDPFAAAPGRRLYETGDLGRYLPDGQLELFGRRDHQVKVRGFRVELGEIETVLGAHPAVREAVVVARPDAFANTRLVAYWVANRSVAEISQEGRELRKWVAATLPEHMIPSLFVALRALPLTPNGKVDRRALPEPEPEAAPDTADVPRSPTEELVAEIWSAVLGMPRVDLEASFFDLGGHSLLATQVASRIRDLLGIDLELRELFENLTVRSLAALVQRRQRQEVEAALPPLVPVPREEDLSLSFAQERLWFLDQLQPGLTAYNMPAALVLAGDRISTVERALAEIVQRHEALRTTFRAVDGRPVQVIAPAAAPSPLPRVDLSSLPPAIASSMARRLAAEEADRPFDLSRGPLLRAVLIALGGGKNLLLINLHHVISDGWSLQVLVKEIATLCWSFAAGEPSPLAELPVQYADFAAWQRSWLTGEPQERLLAYWREQLRGAPESLDLPLDRPRPPRQTFSGAGVPFSLPAELFAPLAAQARRRTVTLFMWLLAAFQSVLWRYTGRRDVIVGSPIANRTRTEVEGLIGFFVNALVLRTDFSGDPSFFELLGRVRETTLGAYAHQDLPFEKLVEELRPERHLSHSPLFQVVFALQDPPFGGLELPGLTLTPLEPYRQEPAKFDLEIYVWREEEGLGGHFIYNTDLFDGTTVRRLARHFAVLVESAVTAPEQPISALSLLDAGEAHQLLTESNDTACVPARLAALHELPAAQATPEATAVVFEEAVLSYAELNRRSNRLAHRLQALGVGPETLVGLCVERSLDMVVAILGILKAGGAYVPLDPSYPPERLAFILDDALAASRAPVLVTEQRLMKLFPAAGEGAPRYQVLCLDADRQSLARESSRSPAVDLRGDHLAYVIYTSGSTGRPKGVPVTHANVARLLTMTEHWFGFNESDVWTLFHSYAFDFSVWEIWGALAYGGTLVVVPQAMTRAPDSFYELLVNAGVTVLNQTPSAFRQLAEVEEVEGVGDLALRRVIFGGEALDLVALRPWVMRHGDRSPELINMYGITETTVHVTYRAVKSADLERAGVSPVGGPIPDLRVYLLGRRLELLPIGVPGEICVGGAGLARGYLGRPSLTAERFVADPFAAPLGGRLYRSGDLARRRAGGELEYLGRIDNQVKIRGFRIELGEIEAALGGHPGVREAVVMARRDAAGDSSANAPRLVAWIVPRGKEITAGELRDHLRQSLPEHMVPAAFVALAALPRLPNGKVDRKALPAPEWISEKGNDTAPRTPVETLLAGLWAQVLGVDKVGAEDNFFEFGGHSLLATRVISRVRRLFGVDLPLRQLFEAPTVAALARRIEAARAAGGVPQAPPLVAAPGDGERGGPLSFAQERLWFLDQLEPGDAAYNVAAAARLRGRLEVAALSAALDAVVERHEALRTTFVNVKGRPRQVVAGHAPVVLSVIDLAALPAPVRRAVARALAHAEARRPFDLAAGPLLRVTLLRLEGEEHVVLLTLHHIVSDGWSMGVALRELGALYGACLARRASPLPELPVQYADYARWQRDWLRGEVLEWQLDYWRRRLAGAPVLELPTDRPRSAVSGRRAGVTLQVALPAALSRELDVLGRRHGATLFMTLLASFATVLGRASGQTDVPVGAPIANRNRLEIEGLIGFFVNTLVLRVDLSSGPEDRREPTFLDLLGRVREIVLEADAHQDVPFEKVVQELDPERQAGTTPFFQAVLALQNAAPEPLALEGLEVEPLPVETGTAKFDLTLELTESESGLAGVLELDRDLFDRTTAARWLGQLETLLAGAAADPSRRLSDLPMLGAAERWQLVGEWNDTRAAYPAASTLPELFEEQVERTPDTVALVFEGRELSYRALNERANQLAHHLRRLGVGPGAEALVGLCLERSVEMVVATLGILKAGGAYLPLDPSYPEARLVRMLAEARSPVVLTQERLTAALPERGATVIRLDADWHRIAGESTTDPTSHAGARRLAYVMYTSGSTGRPKGVAVEHRSVVRLVKASGFAALDRRQIFLQLAPISFDAATLEIWGPLLNGGRLVVSPPAQLALEELGAVIARHRVSTLWLTSGLFHQMVEWQLASLGSLRQLLAGGDVLSPPLVRKALSELSPGTAVRRCGFTLINGYGPTENTTFTTCHRLGSASQVGTTVSIGWPIANTRVRVLDRYLAPVAIGAPGQLCVAGDGLARGYFDQPARTAERFVPEPLFGGPRRGDVRGSSGGRLYLTGDRVRYLADGRLEFLGRLDQQIKIRGFRIEPGEIEAALAAEPEVEVAVVVAWAPAAAEADRRLLATRLVGYVVARPPAPSGAELRARLQARLPEYMVPAAIVLLEALPLTPSGKIDRRALPEPDFGTAAGAAAAEPTAPTTALESFLASVFAEVLGIEKVSTRVSFFQLGGNSLMATQVVSLVQDILPLKLELRNVFESPTVVAIAAQIAASRSTLSDEEKELMDEILADFMRMSQEEEEAE